MKAQKTTYRRVEDIDYALTRKNVKNINLQVKAPEGNVVVSAPSGASIESIERFILSRRDWILHVQEEIASGPQAEAAAATPEEQQRWRDVIKTLVPVLVAKWEPRIGVKAKKIVYRNMKSRWGSCQPSTGRICINTRLYLYPISCLEYVVVHELCHLRVSGHGPAFRALMDEMLPDWRESKALLG